jgi:cytochrome c biogenesis protein CcmG/thiol:disulfide interchange protein DsbE
MTTGNPQESAQIHHGKRSPVWGIVIAAVLVVGFLGIIGASLNQKTSPPIQTGDALPVFSLTTFDGQTISTSELKGKVVLINFWASWCTTCADEAPALQTVWNEVAPDGRVIFLGVDYSDTEPEALAYMQRFGSTYPSGPDLGTRISQTFRITGVPETYVFNTSGKLTSVTIGPFKNAEEIRTVINSALE